MATSRKRLPAKRTASTGRAGSPGQRSSLYVVRDADTLQAAMLAIDKNLHRSVVVINGAGVVVGMLSDGDVRKSLLDGRLFSTPVHRVMNSDFIALAPGEQEKARAIFAEGHVFVIPVIDERGKLLDVLTTSLK